MGKWRDWKRENASLIVAFLTASLLIGVALSQCGCATAKAITASTMTSIVSATIGISKTLPLACEKAQLDAVAKAATRLDAEKETQTIQARCDAAATALEATVKTAVTARDGLKDASSGAWLLGALNAYRNLSELLALLNIEVPKIQ